MLGRTILGYKVDELIGAGGFGSVYKVSKSNIAGTEIRALKHISIPTQKQYLEVLNSMGGDYQKADDYFAGILQNVISEIQIIRSMSAKRSANIVAYYENDIVQHTSPRTYDIYILMEYLTPLTSYIHNNPLTVRNIIDLAKDMLNALNACHSNNIIHRDIKEDNIFVSGDGLYKLGDFGISRVVSSKSGAASMKGTPNYIAPEVYLGKEKYNNTVDLYSLGIVLYRLLNGNRGPFLPSYPNSYTSEDEDIAFEKRMKGMIPALPHHAQNELGEVIVRALMPRDKRYSSAQEFLDSIQRAEHSLSNTELNRSISQIRSTQNTAWPKANPAGMQSKTFAVNTVPPMSKTDKVYTSNPFKTVSDPYEKERTVEPPYQAEKHDNPKVMASNSKSQRISLSYRKYAIMILGSVLAVAILLSMFGKHLDARNIPNSDHDASEQVMSNSDSNITANAQLSDTKYLLEVCPPYQEGGVRYFTNEDDQKVSMAGQTYSNGLYFQNTGSDKFVLFNLNGQYQTLHFTLGHRDGESMEDTTIQIFLDGNLAGEYHISAKGLPQEYVLNLNYAQQMEITGPGWLHYCAIANLELDRDDSWTEDSISNSNISSQSTGPQYLLKACPPYQDGGVRYFTDENGENVSMAGKTYRNGLHFQNTGSDKFVLFNLNGQYQTLHFTLGHRDGESMEDTTIQIFLDGNLAGEYHIPAEGLPQEYELDLNYAQQMEITGPGWLHYCAIAEIVLDRDDSWVQNIATNANTYSQSTGPQYLLKACPPYQDGGARYFTDENGKSVSMAGQTYRNGLHFQNTGSDKFALFNLDGQYQTLHFTLGHKDGESMEDTTIQIFLDGDLAGEYFVPAEGIPQEYVLDLNYAQQMKITGPGWLHYCAIAEIVLDRDDSWVQNTVSSTSTNAQPAGPQYLLKVCPPYQEGGVRYFTDENGKNVSMAGQTYRNGLYFQNTGSDKFVLFNLGRQYQTLHFTLGHRDGESMKDTTIQIFLDGNLAGEYLVPAEGFPQEYVLELNNAQQMKITGPDWLHYCAIANLVVE